MRWSAFLFPPQFRCRLKKLESSKHLKRSIRFAPLFADCRTIRCTVVARNGSRVPAVLCHNASESSINKAVSLLRYRIKVAYDGSDFKGWQFQYEYRSVQGVLEKALSRRLDKTIRVVGAGRTDSGVHSRGQVAHFDHDRIEDLENLEFTLNRMLDRDVRIYDLQLADTSCLDPSRKWHAMYSAKGKLYVYRFSIAKEMDPLERRFRYHCYYPCDLSLLQEGAQIFIGTHDFSSFCSRAGKNEAVERNPYRTIRRIDLIKETDFNYRLEFELNGALYRMVRNITSALFTAACGCRSINEIRDILYSKDRKRAPKAAPPHGLCLEKVFYNDY
eukprot:jgi/Galph1/91/GphlegSOOS_G4832.1